MPTYEYRCAKCGQDVEAFQSFSDAPLTKHEGCGGKLTKVFSPAGIVLKGSGFYKTDSRGSSRSHSGSSSEKSNSDSAGSNSSSEKSSKSSDSGAKSSDSGAKSSDAKSA